MSTMLAHPAGRVVRVLITARVPTAVCRVFLGPRRADRVRDRDPRAFVASAVVAVDHQQACRTRAVGVKHWVEIVRVLPAVRQDAELLPTLAVGRAFTGL